MKTNRKCEDILKKSSMGTETLVKSSNTKLMRTVLFLLINQKLKIFRKVIEFRRN